MVVERISTRSATIRGPVRLKVGEHLTILVEASINVRLRLQARVVRKTSRQEEQQRYGLTLLEVSEEQLPHIVALCNTQERNNS